MKLLFENKFASLYLDEKYKVFQMIWHEETRQMTNKEFKEILLKYSTYISNNTKGVMHNMVNNHYILNEEMQYWVDENINAKALHLGLINVAFLITSNLFAQVSVEEAMKGNIGKHLKIEYFEDKDKAWNWLIKQSK